MSWYYADAGQQAGPVDDAQIEALIASGKITPDTLVWRQGMANWQPLKEARPAGAPTAATPAPAEQPAGAATPGGSSGGVVCCECGQAFPPEQTIRYGDRYVCAGCKPVFLQRLAEGVAPGGATVPGNATPEEILQRDYNIDIGGGLERAWSTVSKNFGKAIVANLIYGGVILAVVAVVMGIVFLGVGVGGNAGRPGPGAIGAIALAVVIGLVAVLALIVLHAGLSWFFLNLYRNGDAEYGLVFDGFRGRIGSLLGSWFVQAVIGFVATLPFSIIIQVIAMSKPNQGVMLALTFLLQIMSTAISVYLSMLWIYTNLLILDKGMSFWPAMQFSRRMVTRRWWMTFLFVLVAGVIGGVGFLACGVGVLVSMPVCQTMIAILFDDNFRDLADQG